MEFLHAYNDGSCLYRMSARSLCQIPIWKGNRTIDPAHVEQLKRSIGDKIVMLDSGYKIIRYGEEDENGRRMKKSYIVDGQHRIQVLHDAFSVLRPDMDFIVTVTELDVSSEEQAIQYFNQINHAKPISYTEDDQMVANRYLTGILRVFDSKLKLIRQGATRRPYLSSDRLREHIVKSIQRVRTYSVDRFVELVQSVHEHLLKEVQERAQTGPPGPETTMARKMLELGFALAWDERFTWLKRLGRDN